MKRVMLALGAVAVLASVGGCVTNPKTTVMNLDTTDPRWVSRKCVAARKDVYEYNDHGTTSTVVGLAGNLAFPFAGTAGSLALSKSQDHERKTLNKEVEAACVSKHRRRRD